MILLALLLVQSLSPVSGPKGSVCATPDRGHSATVEPCCTAWPCGRPGAQEYATSGPDQRDTLAAFADAPIASLAARIRPEPATISGGAAPSRHSRPGLVLRI